MANQLLLSVSALASCALVINLIIFWLQLGSQKGRRQAGPDDATIGAVWVCLFAALGYARWSLTKANTNETAKHTAKRLLDTFILVCALYPLYAIAPGDDRIALIANIAIIILAFVTTVLSAHVDRSASLIVFLVALWIIYASWLTLQELQGAQ